MEDRNLSSTEIAGALEQYERIRADGEKYQQHAYETRLRDEFAMAALTGIMAAGRNGSSLYYAGLAYDMADAMMEARKR